MRGNMLLKITELSKSLRAIVHWAGKGLLFGVGPQVIKQIVPLLKHEVTISEFADKELGPTLAVLPVRPYVPK